MSVPAVCCALLESGTRSFDTESATTLVASMGILAGRPGVSTAVAGLIRNPAWINAATASPPVLLKRASLEDTSKK